MKSDAEVNHLVNDVLLDPNFKLEDLQGFNVARENQQSNTEEKKSPFFDSFQTADIDIEVPSGGYHQAHFLFQDLSIGIDCYYPSLILVAPCFPFLFLAL